MQRGVLDGAQHERIECALQQLQIAIGQGSRAAGSIPAALSVRPRAVGVARLMHH